MKIQNTVAPIILMTTLLVSGCGGGSSTTDQPIIKGMWEDPANTTTTAKKAIILANGEAWILYLESGIGNKFTQLQLKTDGGNISTTSGTHYRLTAPAASETASSSGTFSSKGVINSTVTSSSGTTTLNLNYNVSRSETAAKRSDASKTWTAAYNGGASTVTFTVADTAGNNLSGTSTTSCNYSGSLQPRSSDPAFFDVSFTETCLVGAPVILSGVAVLNEAKTALSIVAATADKMSGFLFIGQ
jgi:hypothetical protein